jgi:hypothetical protein
MKVLAIALISMIAVCNGMTMMEKCPMAFNFSKKRSIMNVMAQVEEQLKSGGPMDAITRILAEFEEEIHAEQLAHD